MSAAPPGGRGALLRVGGLPPSDPRRWRAAVIGRYLDGENGLADQLQDAFGPGQLNLADRGFFSMDRWIRFSGTGAGLLWRVKNGAKCVPFQTLKILKDGSELVLLHESSGMRARRRTAAGDPALPSLPDTAPRLVCFTRLPPTRTGRTPPHAGRDTAIAAPPPGRADRQRTAGRTPAERRTRTSEPADYTLTIIPSNLPKTDVSPGS